MEFYASILLFSVSTSITPGPNTVMLMSTSLNYGVRGSLPAYFGVCLGFMLMQMAIALGLGGLFVVFPWLHYAIKYVGALYLLFLAWKIAQEWAAEHPIGSQARWLLAGGGTAMGEPKSDYYRCWWYCGLYSTR